MSAIESSVAPVELDELVSVLPDTRWDRFEALLARLSERLNPILVKEARQALRSKQFVTTFFLMLAAGWLWSIFGLAGLGPGVYYSADGPTMFYGYHLILAIPLLLVVPYAAFHSLSAERQDRTYELVSITALNERQILSGKLGSVLLQMIVYLSAIFPCLAFTYLLRGLDIFTILLAVSYTAFMALGLAAVGLLLATLMPPRQRQIGNAIIFVVVLCGSLWANLIWVFGMVSVGGVFVDSTDFWLLNLGWLTFYVNCFAVVFLAARSQLMTVCQNRSTAIRAALVTTQASWLGWWAYGQMRWGGNTIFAFVFFTTMFWWLAGVFLTGEPTTLSPRVKRDLPQTPVGRLFLTWFSPGPGTGYAFVVANMVAACLLANLPYQRIAAAYGITAPATIAATTGPTRLTRLDLLEACSVATSYLVIYLGLGKLLLGAISRITPVRLTTRVLVHICLVLMGSGIPWAIQMSVPRWRMLGYTLLQITNPVWTIYESCSKGVPVVGSVLVYGLGGAAICVWLLSVPSLLEELKQVRVAKPPRVVEDDAEIAALAAGPPQPASPWDT